MVAWALLLVVKVLVLRNVLFIALAIILKVNLLRGPKDTQSKSPSL